MDQRNSILLDQNLRKTSVEREDSLAIWQKSILYDEGWRGKFLKLFRSSISTYTVSLLLIFINGFIPESPSFEKDISETSKQTIARIDSLNLMVRSIEETDTMILYNIGEIRAIIDSIVTMKIEKTEKQSKGSRRRTQKAK